jgi:cytosine/adenosine deaminase-related metal-dependent hydrolase
MNDSSRRLFRARYVVPVVGPVIENGMVEVRGGVIAAVGQASMRTAEDSEDAVEAALLPGFVNAHTHLELTHLAGRIPTGNGFIPWIEDLVRTLRVCGDAEPLIRASVRAAVRQCLAHGVTAVGDVTRLPELVRPLLRESPLRVVSFGEVIAVGAIRSHLETAVAAAVDAAAAGPWLRIGVSPHSPYTVEPVGLCVCGERAKERELPLSIHLAETKDEILFTTEQRGPLRDYLDRLGVWDDDVPCPGEPPVDLARSCGLLAGSSIVAHANYLTDDDIAVLASTGAHVAFCPRTHDAFGHQPHRFRDLLAAGVNVCIATDSAASTPTLSVLDELRWMHAMYGDVSPLDLLAMGTIRGARALGWADRIGSIEIGKSADLVIVPLEPDGPRDPIQNVLSSDRAVTATFIAGERVG